MWNGIMFFNMPKIEEKTDFSDGMVDGQMTDVGDQTYFLRILAEMKKTDEVSPTIQLTIMI